MDIPQRNLPNDKSSKRLLFVDHLRAALVILVVLHHLAVIYGANTPFYYMEPRYQDILALIVLVVFQLLNQAYFMGFFFLISGYFTPSSFNHKGPVSFLKDRLLRLGIPTLIFMFILNPIASIGIYQMPASLAKLTTPFTWQQYPGLIGFGPLWFAVMLLIFDFGYAAWRLVAKRWTDRPAKRSGLPSYRTITAFILALAIASYLVRIVLPLGKYALGFPSLAYLPQYLGFFLIGIAVYHGNWFQTVPGRMGKWGFGMAAVATIILFPIALSGKAAFLGNGHWQSGIYTLWDSTSRLG